MVIAAAVRWAALGNAMIRCEISSNCFSGRNPCRSASVRPSWPNAARALLEPLIRLPMFRVMNVMSVPACWTLMPASSAAWANAWNVPTLMPSRRAVLLTLSKSAAVLPSLENSATKDVTMISGANSVLMANPRALTPTAAMVAPRPRPTKPASELVSMLLRPPA